MPQDQKDDLLEALDLAGAETMKQLCSTSPVEWNKVQGIGAKLWALRDSIEKL